MLKHRVVAEKALGKPLPSYAVVHHVDEDSNNNEPSNLVICPNDSYHRLLHVRMAAMQACGNPNYRTCVICHEYDDPSKMQFKQNAYRGSYRHKACISLDNKRQHAKRVAERLEREEQMADLKKQTLQRN